MKLVRQCIIACAASVLLSASSATAQEKELRVGYQPNPIQDASIAMMEKWGAKHGVKITKIPDSFGWIWLSPTRNSLPWSGRRAAASRRPYE